MMKANKTLPLTTEKEFLAILENRFFAFESRHPSIKWADVVKKLQHNKQKLWSLHQMEITGGEPDVVGTETATNNFIFFDCATESPTGRRSLCYDKAALESRKENKPTNNVIDVAAAMGVTLLTEQQYRYLQTLGNFDTKTSSWIDTPHDIRKLGGALFGDRRYNAVFIYHNGASSYYAARGFRACLTI